jgi:hypothetical protein
METANILQAVEQYRKELEQVAITNPATRYFPTHDDAATQRIREFQQVGTQLWGDRMNGHA